MVLAFGHSLGGSIEAIGSELEEVWGFAGRSSEVHEIWASYV